MRIQNVFPVAAALVAIAWLAAAPAPALADEHTEGAGQVTATVSYEQPEAYEYTDVWLTITREGAIGFDAPVAIDDCEEPYCMPAGAYSDASGITVRDLDGDGEPEVIVDAFTGGAHCCFVSWVLRWAGTAYTPRTRNWADIGYRLADSNRDGTLEFRTGDARFAYAFASFADSRFPVRVYEYQHGAFRDVAAANRPLVREDARRLKREYRKRRNGPFSLGVLAAWTADEYVLGRKRAAHRFLNAEQRAGRLRSLDGWKSGRALIRHLKHRLRAWGY